MDRKLRRAVLERLAAVDEMATQNLPVPVARTQLKSITDGWRELLLEHQPDPKGRCPVCSGWLRHRRWPCQVWVTAHQHLLGDGPAPLEGAGQKSNRVPGPRQVEVIPRQVGTAAATNRTPADQIHAHRGDDEAKDHFPSAATPNVPIHRAAVTERVPALSPAWPAHRSPD